VRTKAATQALFDAQARYFVADESAAVLKICGGVADLGDLGLGIDQPVFVDPDPLAGFDADHPPPWVEEAAKRATPSCPSIRPWPPTPPPGRRARAPRAVALVAAGAAAVLVVAGMAFLLLFRRKA